MNLIRGMRKPRWQHKASLPSSYIIPIDALPQDTKVVLWCRVSTSGQGKNGNHINQGDKMRAACEDRGLIVVDVKYSDENAGNSKDALLEAANKARMAGAVLMAESTSRFVRHPEYHSNRHPDLMPTSDQLRRLRRVCGDVQLVTILDPDASWQEERRFQTKRGQQQKGKKGGRPPGKAKPKKAEPEKYPGYKKAEREMLLPIIAKRVKEGVVVRKIAKELGKQKTQIQRWIERLRKDEKAKTRGG